MAILALDRREPATARGDAVAPAPTWPLTAAIAKGDERAFAEFYERWFDRVYAKARHVTRRDEAFCLDVVQDCMMRVVGKMRPLQSERAVAAWMARTLMSTAIDRMRQDERRLRRERESAARATGTAPGPELTDGLEVAEQTTWLRARLMELPAADRQLILERFEGGKTLDAIGQAHGMSVHAAHGRIWRIVNRLRRAAKEIFDD